MSFQDARITLLMTIISAGTDLNRLPVAIKTRDLAGISDCNVPSIDVLIVSRVATKRLNLRVGARLAVEMTHCSTTFWPGLVNTILNFGI